MLNAPLPDYLHWLTEKIEGMLRPAAFLKPHPTAKSPRGGTRAWGQPDRPRDAAWANIVRHQDWQQSPLDGNSFWLQLNLEEIPAAARKPSWPTVGLVWVFIDLSDHWDASVYFDPRPAAKIPWQEPLDKTPPPAARWMEALTAPDVTEQTFPEVAYARDSTQDLVEWLLTHYQNRLPSDIQVGGWNWPCQGWFDERNETFVCSMSRQPFGDHGEVSLYYTPERGFWAFIETN